MPRTTDRHLRTFPPPCGEGGPAEGRWVGVHHSRVTSFRLPSRPHPDFHVAGASVEVRPPRQGEVGKRESAYGVSERPSANPPLPWGEGFRPRRRRARWRPRRLGRKGEGLCPQRIGLSPSPFSPKLACRFAKAQSPLPMGEAVPLFAPPLRSGGGDHPQDGGGGAHPQDDPIGRLTLRRRSPR